MKNITYKGLLLGILALSLLIGTTFADIAIVNGNVIENETSAPVPGADVTVECDINGNTISTVSDSFGNFYTATLECPVNTTVTVSAVKGTLSGSKQADLTGLSIDLSVAVVTVPVFAPEIILFLAGIMILAPGFAYILKRRK